MKISKILVVLCSVFILTFCLADDEYEELEHGRNHIYRSLEYLNLDENQYTKIKRILIEYKNEYQKFLEFSFLKRLELQKIMQAEVFDEQKYIKIHGELKNQSAIIEAAKFKKIHEVLSPSQRVKFSYFLGEWEID